MPFSILNNVVPLPDKRQFPEELQSTGDHLKHARLTRNILIKDVCAYLKIDRDTLRGWEQNLFEPHVSHYPVIISFLSYNPCQIESSSLSGKIKKYRYAHGLTQKQFGALLDIDACVVWEWESNERLPIPKNKTRVLELIQKG